MLNLSTLAERRLSICSTLFRQIICESHVLHYLLLAKRDAEVAGVRDHLINIQQFVRVHPNTKTLLSHMCFLIFSDTFMLGCLLIFIVWMFVLYHTSPASWLPESNKCYVMSKLCQRAQAGYVVQGLLLTASKELWCGKTPLVEGQTASLAWSSPLSTAQIHQQVSCQTKLDVVMQAKGQGTEIHRRIWASQGALRFCRFWSSSSEASLQHKWQKIMLARTGKQGISVGQRHPDIRHRCQHTVRDWIWPSMGSNFPVSLKVPPTHRTTGRDTSQPDQLCVR